MLFIKVELEPLSNYKYESAGPGFKGCASRRYVVGASVTRKIDHGIRHRG